MTSLSQGGGGENFVSTLLKRQKQKPCVWCGGSQIFCDALNKILILRNILMQFQHSKITSTKKKRIKIQIHFHYDQPFLRSLPCTRDLRQLKFSRKTKLNGVSNNHSPLRRSSQPTLTKKGYERR